MAEDDHPILRLHIRVYKAVNEGSGPGFLARIEGCNIGPFSGQTGVEARRKADEWRKEEVRKELARRTAIQKRVDGMKQARVAQTAGQPQGEAR